MSILTRQTDLCVILQTTDCFVQNRYKNWKTDVNWLKQS